MNPFGVGFGKRSCRFVVMAVFVFVLCAPVHAAPKFLFLFIGDGMGVAHVNLGEVFLAGGRRERGDRTVREGQLAMTGLPVSGTTRTNSLSGVTDSAAAGTAIATGRKTVNGALAMNPTSGERFRSIAYLAKERGMKVGIVTSAFLQDATPAAFYAHSPKRGAHYDIGCQLASSGFDYFAGGGFRNPKGKSGKERNLYDVASSAGYRVANTRESLGALRAGTKAIASNPHLSSGYMPWVADVLHGGARERIPLAEFLKKGIDLLACEEGFLIVVEGGLIDIASHANDAAAMVHELLDFDEAVAVALSFYRQHPEETLLVVASDHETGGLRLAPQKGDEEREALYRGLSRQRGSHAVFERSVPPRAGARIEPYLSRARRFFTDELASTDALREAWRMSMTKARPVKDPSYAKRYGPYDPFTVACMRQANACVGISWSTFYHTGKPTPVFAVGPGSSRLAGEYENTKIFEVFKVAVEGRGALDRALD